MNYNNPKIDSVIYGDIPVLSEYTEADWRELAIACLDQGDVSVRTQERIREMAENDSRVKRKNFNP
jgi:hypothetical protein